MLHLQKENKNVPFIGRPPAASTATGYPKQHEKERDLLL